MTKYWMIALLALGGCAKTPSVEPSADQGVQLDGIVIDRPTDAMVIDATIDAMPPQDAGDPGVVCAPSDVTLRVDPDGPGTQVSPAIAADGDGLWVVYSRSRDIWATRLGCNGLPTVAPFGVTGGVFKDGSPDVAVGPAGVIFVWNRAPSLTDPNFATRYRIFDHDGTPRGNSQPLITQRDGADFRGSHWMPQVAATPDGFVIVGVRGVGALEFERGFVYGQRLNAAGEPIGETASAEQRMTAQVGPDVGVAADGTVWIAWAEGDGLNSPIVAAPWTDDPVLVPQPSFPAMNDSTLSSTSITAGVQSFVLGRGGRGGHNVLVRQLDGEARFEVGDMSAIDIYPAMAVQRGETGDDGALIAWFKIRGSDWMGWWGPSPAAVWTQRLDLSDGLVAVGDPVEIELVDPAVPFPMAIAALADGRYALVWTEGDRVSRVRLRFVDP